MDRQEEQFLAKVLEQVHEKLLQISEKMGENAKDMESMNDYFWENYTEFDEYGYEMYDNKQAMKTRLTQQEEYGRDRMRLKKMLDSPYFGRVDFLYDGEDKEETYYVGIGNLSREHTAQPLVYDWRAPVCGLFYDYDRGRAQYTAPVGVLTGEILRKRQYKIQKGKLEFVLETDMNIDDEILQQALSEHADAKLKSIVTTIQKEQNSIIRDDRHRILVVQGCAGSGKTSVALHRIAYLLYHNRDTLNASQVLVLSPNHIFGDYISRILPELGEENVAEMTLDDYSYRELLPYGEAEDRYDEIERALQGKMRPEAAYKQSPDYVKELDEFILRLEWEAAELKDFSYKKMYMSEDRISRLFYEKFCDVPIFSRLEKIAEYLIDDAETLLGRDMEEEERTAVLEKINSMYRITDVRQLYNQFLCRSGREKQQITGERIPYEDVYPLLYLSYMTKEQPKRRRVRHIVVDEMQDYSYLQYLILQKMFDCPMTILGDRLQTMAEKPQNVMKFLPSIFGKNIFYVQMNKSYRSTMEIMEFAKKSADRKMAETVHRHGEKPVVQCLKSREAMMDTVAEQLRQLKELTTVAVLCTDARAARSVYGELKSRGIEAALFHKDSMKFLAGVSVMPFYLAKGLEFDAVFIPDVQEYTSPLKKQALYINITRALHVLKLFRIDI